MAHLAKDVAVGAQDAFDAVMGTVRIVFVAEGYLAVCKELGGKGLVNDKLTLTMAEGDAVGIAQLKACKPG